jgi:copper(I)-binding protein
MNRNTASYITAVALIGLPMSSVVAHDFKHGPITIAHPFVRVDPACDSGTTKAHVMLLVNQGKLTDRLIAADLADGARGRILASSKQHGAALQPVTGVDIAAGSRTALMPPAYAIEFPISSKDLQPGSAVAATLHFERAGVAKVTFVIEAVREHGKRCDASPAPDPKEHAHGHKH